MPAKDLGAKHTCFKCGTKFYDMKKPEPLCPKCGADQRESPALKAPPPTERRTRAAARPAPVAEAEEVETVEADVEEDLDEDDDDEDDAEKDEP
jgi:uncharacterized protein (TIGR02300 family)